MKNQGKMWKWGKVLKSQTIKRNVLKREKYEILALKKIAETFSETSKRICSTVNTFQFKAFASSKIVMLCFPNFVHVRNKIYYPKNRKVNLELQRKKSPLRVLNYIWIFNKVFSKQKSRFSTFFQKWQSVWKSQSL